MLVQFENMLFVFIYFFLIHTITELWILTDSGAHIQKFIMTTADFNYAVMLLASFPQEIGNCLPRQYKQTVSNLKTLALVVISIPYSYFL